MASRKQTPTKFITIESAVISSNNAADDPSSTAPPNEEKNSVTAADGENGFDAFLGFLYSDKPITPNTNSNNQTMSKSPPQQQQEEDQPAPQKRSGCEAVGDKVDESISSFFYKIGNFCSFRPKTTIAIALVVAIACASGMVKLNTESRPEKVSSTTE